VNTTTFPDAALSRARYHAHAQRHDARLREREARLDALSSEQPEAVARQ
jgi:hypothetical protein